MISVLTFGNHAEAPLAHSDASAIRAWLEDGDESAATWLFEKYSPLVMHVCSRKLPRTWMTDDAAQETMARAFQSLRSFCTDRSFSSWIATIASHVCVDHLRVFGRRVEIPFKELDGCPAEIAIPDRTEKVSVARELVESLAPESREVVELHYFAGLSFREIAGRAGLSQSNVAIRLIRARQELSARAATLARRR